MKLYFQNSHTKKILIGEYETTQECLKEVYSQCVEKFGEPPHYLRHWENAAGETVYDVGSWSEFFIISKEEEK